MSTNTRDSMDNKKYRLISIVLIMLILAGFVCLYVIADAKAAGDEPASAPWTGTATEPQIDEADTYLISSPEELAWVAGVVNGTITEGINIPTDSSFAGKTVKLTQNIILNAEVQMNADGNVTNSDSLLQWTPIGGNYTEDNTLIPFSGTFDGLEYAVKGLYINDDTKNNQGLFGYVDGGTIKNVDIADSYIYVRTVAGGIVGKCNNGIIENCTNDGRISAVATGKGVMSCGGGVIGSAQGNCSILDCCNYGNIQGLFSIGGIVGFMSVTGEQQITINNCCNEGTISGSMIGGMLGVINTDIDLSAGNKALYISNSFNKGIINGNSLSGGLVSGLMYSEINNCYNTAAIHGSTVGGVAGQAYASDIINCYNRGNLFVDKDNPENYYTAGGICGAITAGAVKNCYSTGTIESQYSNTSIGGIVGIIVAYTATEPAVVTTVDYCYWLLPAAQTINGVDRSDAEKLGVGINNDTGGTCTTYSFTEAQGKGIENDASAIIGDSDYITSLNSLVLALNTWIYDYCRNASEETDITKYSDWLTNYDDYPSLYSGCYQCVEPSVDETGTYLINTPEELAWVAGVVNETVTEGNNIPAVSSFEGATVKLANDIVLNEEIQFDTAGYVTNTDTLKQWMPIGKYTSAGFSGCFDGSDHVVKGLYINGSLNNQGLFGDVKGGTVKNIRIEDSYIHVGFNVGGIAGSCTDGIIDNCDYYGSINAAISAGKGGASGGGIVGAASGKSSILNCCNNGNITGLKVVGGIVGSVRSYDSINSIICIDNCSNSGDIQGSYIGGIVGRSVGSDDENVVNVLNCSNTGLISGDSLSGGLIGGMSYSEIINCWNTAAIHGSTVGGVVGQADASDIINCYNRGNLFVDKDNPDNIYTAGGICGEITAGIVENCYSTGAIEANYSDTSIGGIAGSIVTDTENDPVVSTVIDYCYWLLPAAQTINGVDRSDAEKLGVGINNDTGGTCTTYSFTETQGKGMENDAAAVIAADSSYANTNALLTALHNWVAVEQTTDKLYYDWLADDEAEPKNNGYPVLVKEEDVVSGSCGDSLTWTYDMISATLTISGTGDMYDYFYDSFAPWYEQYRNQIEKVTIESGVTSVGTYAFYDCGNVTEISIPEGVTKIGERAFEYCYDLAAINLPDSVVTLGEYAFDSCGLSEITIPQNVNDIGERAFSYCGQLAAINVDANNTNYSSIDGVLFNKNKTSIILYPQAKTDTTYSIPVNVTNIGTCAFKNCGITSITIPDGVTTIGDEAFADCYALISISLPDSIVAVGSNAFNGNAWFNEQPEDAILCLNKVVLGYKGTVNSDTIITIPEETTCIADYAFAWCYDLSNITIGNKVKHIGDSAFYNCCNYLSNITIPDSVISIGDSAFESCGNLRRVTIGSSANEIGDFAFRYCSLGCAIFNGNAPTEFGEGVFEGSGSEFKIYYNADKTGWSTPEWKSYSSAPLSETVVSGTCGEALSWTYNMISATLTISGTGDMYDYSYDSFAPWYEQYRNQIEKVTIESGVTSVGTYAFYDFGNATEISIPEGVTKIGERAFEYCYNLAEINLPDSVVTLGEYSFSSCYSLSEITIPQNVNDIDEQAFSYCGQLAAINVDANNPNYSSIDGVLFNKNKTSIILYPQGKTDVTYLIPANVTSIEPGAFYDCDNITEILIPNKTITIGAEAFYNCENLKSITILDGVTSIGDNAFAYCYELSSISLPDSITAVGEDAFYATKWVNNQPQNELMCLNKVVLGYNGYIYSDTIITIPEYTTCIADNAFYGDTNLSNIAIGNNVKYIGDSAFEYCYDLTNIIIPKSVINIGGHAFWACNDLSSITIPESVTSIGDEAFGYCNELVYAYFTGNAPEDFGESVFAHCDDRFKIYYLEGKTGWTTPEWNDYPAIPISADGITSGSCGDNVTWSLDVFKGDLTVSGSGAMENYTDEQSAPWELSKTEIKTVSIAEGVTNIGDTAFKGCPELTTIIMPDTVARIGSYAFKGCSKLTTADIPDSVDVIEEGAFYGCTALDDLKLSGNVREIAYRSFASCSSLTTLTVPDSVQTINEYAFYNCQDLNRVQLSANVREIACRSFASCSSLPEIEMPATLTDLGDSAFKNDAALHKALFKGDAPQPWLDSVFDGTAADLQIHYYEGTTGWGTQGNLVPINVAGISIASEPLVSTYLVQDTLDSDGLAVNVNYADEYSRTITSGFDLEYDFSSAGEKEVIVSYYGQETTFNVTVNEVAGKMLTGLTAEFNQGSNFFYVTDKLADNLQVITDNLVVTASYADDSSQTLTSANYEVSGDLSVIDDNNLSTLTIKYVEDGLSRKATFTVKVNDLVLIEWFPDTNFCSYVYTTVLGKTETDGNASSYALSLADIETIEACTELDVADKAVSSLKGIERFTALEVLNCQNNNITELDISGCSALQVLNCSNNRFTVLNLTNNTALISLDCSNNNVRYLDVSACTALKELNCSHNAISGTLDVSNFTSLTSLDCSNNQLTGLTVSGCSALEKLNCSHNAISGTLDVSNFTELTSLDCSNNQLTGLTVSGCSALEKLNCSHNAISGTLDVSNFSELTSLDCSNNQLTGLTVSGCSALEKLNCSNNALSGTLDVSACTELEEFDCSGNPEITELIFDEQAKPQLLLRSREVVTLAAAATGDRKLKQLNCSGTAITDIDVSSFPQLEVLNVSNTAIEKLDLGANDKLSELDVRGCGSLQAVTTQLIFIGEKSDDTVVVDLSAEATKGTMTYPDSTADIIYDNTTNIVTFNTLTAAAKGFNYSQILNETGTQLAVKGKVIYVEKIDITTAATTSQYYVGDSLTTDGLVLQVTYKDCTTNDSIIKELKSDFSATIEAEYYTDGKFIQAGTEVPVTVSFKGCSTMYDVVVKSRPVTEIAEVTYQQVEGKDYDIVTVNFGLALTQPSGYIIVAAYDDNNQMLASSLKQVHSGETSTDCIIRGAANCTNIKAFLVNDVNKCQPLTATVAASLE